MEPLDEAYFRWLYTKVASDRYRVRTKTYWSLMRQLYGNPFVWLVANDDNRCADGVALRDQFALERRVDLDPEWVGYQCSFLEMLIALSDRMAFEAGEERVQCFWHLLENLGLSHINDATYDNLFEVEIGEVLDRVTWRTYQYNGQGGLFPLRGADEDQRKVELWYQLNAYLMERD